MATIKETLTNGITEGIHGINNAGITDPVKLDAAIKDLAARQADLAEEEYRKLADTQKQAIMVAEMSQGNDFTKNARPMVVYAGLFFIFIVYAVIPFIAFIQNRTPKPDFTLPDQFWWAWSGVVSVWVLGRSYEKINAPNTISKIITGS